MGKTAGIFFVLTLLTFTLFSSYPLFSQDRPAGGKVLPFQQDSPVAGNDEEVAMHYYQIRDFIKAAEIYERLYDQKPTNYTYTYLYFCLLEIKEFNKAEKLVKRQQKNEPAALRYLVDLGYVNYRAGNIEKARKLYEEALKKLGPDQQQVFDLSNAFLLKGENDFAVRTYLKGRQLIVTYPFGFELASIYERMGDFKNAMEEYLNLLELNKTYLNTVEDRIQSLLALDIDNEKNEIFRKLLLLRVQKNPEKTWLTELLWWYSIQQKDFDLALIQGKALDRRLQENGERLLQLAGMAVSNQNYEIALQVYEYLVAKGTRYEYYDYSRREMVNTRYRMVLSEPAPSRKQMEALQKELRDELKKSGENNLNTSVMKNLAHLEGFYLGNPDSAIAILNRAIEMGGPTPQERSECKLELADILLFTDDVWQATLLYQQVYKDYKNDVLGQEAKFKNTKLSFYIGEFKWAQAQADVLKAATSKLIANDALALSLLISENLDADSNTIALGYYARADLLDFRNAEAMALNTLDSISATFSEHPILERVIYKKAEIYKKIGQFPVADSLFGMVVKSYPEGIMADESLMQQAELNEKQLSNKQRAMTLYQELFDKYPGSIFVPDARKRFRILRGDTVKL